MMSKISIIVPVKEINDYIREAIPKHLELDYPDFEVLILPDKSSGESFDSKVRIIPTYPRTGPADKRDIGTREARGEILAFIDDDAYPHSDWLKNAIGYFDDEGVAAVCGPGVTPDSDSVGQKVSGWVQASRLGGGNYTYRFIPQKKRYVDDYPSMNFIVRKKDFEAAGGFDSHFWPGEDTKLCLDLTHWLGKKIIYDPEVLVYHHRRSLWRPHLRQLGGYGLHRGHFARALPQTSRRLSYFIPSLFLIYILFLPLLPLTTPFSTSKVNSTVLGVATAPTPLLANLSPLILLMFAPLAIYTLLLFLTAVWVYRRARDVRVAFLTVPGIFVTHIWYGLRFIQGFFSRELRR